MGDYYIRISLMSNDNEEDSETLTFDSEVDAQGAYDDLSADLESIGRKHGG